ncbi:hypothetical protein L2E82_36023 [Cichorium intybus]|uniref:Uncharacterized protein n=1 Tax=Cichorium intybus TaxID=13427 RepID=A0ACB9BQI0_CICIN|nr:hypothetical protein L2E82_36023 [Cichorium intybus]
MLNLPTDGPSIVDTLIQQSVPKIEILMIPSPIFHYLEAGSIDPDKIRYVEKTDACPVILNWDNGSDNITLISNPNAWTQMANIIFMDIPSGTGFSYAETTDGSSSSNNIMASQANEFIKKFLIDHPKFRKTPLYVAGISYVGIVVPKITLDLYEGNERGDQPRVNIQGYILLSPLTDKFKDFNSRFEFAHRMALISDDIYMSAKKTCNDNYLNIDTVNSLCANSLQQYEQVRIVNFIYLHI